MLKPDIKEKGAVIQRDRASYALTPHTPAGLVSSSQLRRIAEVADRFQVRQIKLTSAQRITLIGIAEEEIDAAWDALGEPIGSVTGLCVRSVKICPGTDYCKRGLQDSVAVGLEVDRRFHGRKLPWKLKLGVSGCPNDCAETCVKDLGLIGTHHGWHLTVGGNGGSQPRLSRRLFDHLSEDQALRALDRLLDWFVAQERKCRFGKLAAEVGLDQLREIALEA